MIKQCAVGDKSGIRFDISEEYFWTNKGQQLGEVLKESPNLNTVFYDFWYTTTFNLFSVGSVYWNVLENLFGVIQSVYILDPMYVRYEEDLINNIAHYVATINGTECCLIPERVIAFKLTDQEESGYEELARFFLISGPKQDEAIEICKEAYKRAKDICKLNKEEETLEMKVEKLSPTANDVVLLSVSETDKVTQEQLEEWQKYFMDKYGCAVVWTASGTQAEMFNEEKMGELGWIKKRDYRREFF